MKSENVKDPKLEKKIQKVMEEHEKEKEMEKARKKLEEFKKIKPEIEPKPSKTGLELLEESLESILNKKSVKSKEELNRYFSLHKIDNYRFTGKYLLSDTNKEINSGFEFEFGGFPRGFVPEAVYDVILKENKQIDDDSIKKIRAKKMIEKNRQWPRLKTTDVSKWAKKEFGDDKIVIEKTNYEKGYYKSPGIFIQGYFLADKEEILNEVQEADKEFTYNLAIGKKYWLSTPLTSFTYPNYLGSRGRDGTRDIRRPIYKYESNNQKSKIKPGKGKDLAKLVEKMDVVLEEKMTEFQSLFEYWQKLDNELEKLHKEYFNRKEEFHKRFYS